MLVNFSNFDFSNQPVLILKDAAGTPICPLGAATNIRLDLHFNETSVLEFTMPAFADGIKTPGYDEISGMQVVEFQGIGQFKLIKPVEVSDGALITKNCKAYSLEYEFAFKKITLQKSTYKFFDSAFEPESTLLGIIMAEMPSWSIGTVPESISNRYRTFEVENENIYNFIKGTIQEAYGCIFDFDTIERKVHVIDVDDEASVSPIYMSAYNLAKKIEITEDSEGIITRLDVNGAEGVNIRDVNPDGTNKIINLDYFMNTANFDSETVSKYENWKSTRDANLKPYYTNSIRYSTAVAELAVIDAKLTDLNSELTSIQNELAVAFQAIAQKLEGVDAATTNEIKSRLKAKETEIKSKEAERAKIENRKNDLLANIKAINSACAFNSFFSESELLLIDRYIKDDSISESSFEATSVSSYSGTTASKSADTLTFFIEDTTFEYANTATDVIFHEFKGGFIVFSNGYGGQIINATLETDSNNKTFLLSVRFGVCVVEGTTYHSGSFTASGSYTSLTHNAEADPELTDWFSGTELTLYAGNTDTFFTLDTNEYDKRRVAWDLYEYGVEVLNRLAQPACTFTVDCANFLSIDDFVTFRNALKFGAKVYIEGAFGRLLKPICIGASVSFSNPSSLTLKFGDSFVSSDSTFKMVELLDQSVSMGKNLDASKYVYSAFVDSGASTGMRTFMTSALDVAKNAILSSGNQAISFNDAGLRLRKWANSEKNAYDPEQIWMNNNSILLTKDDWDSAEMAIGKFHDDNLGDCWGIVAPKVVGTLLAGSSLVLESEKKDGNTSIFRVDSDGCRLHNSNFSVQSAAGQILLDPDIGIMAGTAPLVQEVTEEIQDGEVTIYETSIKPIEENRKFWVDNAGNVHLKGTLYGADGVFTGTLEGADGTFNGTLTAQSMIIDSTTGAEFVVDQYVTSIVESAAENDIMPAVRTEIQQSSEDINMRIDGIESNLKWFTFDTDGFTVRRPAYQDENGVDQPASKWSTLVDEEGYHINHDDVAGQHVGSFARNSLMTRGYTLDGSSIVMTSASNGAWVWSD